MLQAKWPLFVNCFYGGPDGSPAALKSLRRSPPKWILRSFPVCTPPSNRIHLYLISSSVDQQTLVRDAYNKPEAVMFSTRLPWQSSQQPIEICLQESRPPKLCHHPIGLVQSPFGSKHPLPTIVSRSLFVLWDISDLQIWDHLVTGIGKCVLT